MSQHPEHCTCAYCYELRLARLQSTPSPHGHAYPRRSSHHLSPEPPFAASMHRSRSFGNAPRPEINIYNEVNPIFTPPSPDFRGRSGVRLGDDLLVDELAALRLPRSRSRGCSDAMFYGRPPSPSFSQWEHARRDYEDRIRQEYELRLLQDEIKRKAAADKAKADEVAMRRKIEQEKIDAKIKEEKEWNEFLVKQQQKKDKAKKEKEEEEAKLEAAMAERLARYGFPYHQIDSIVKPPRASNNSMTLTVPGTRAPEYAKVHRKYLDVETLRRYRLRYEYDTNRDYIIILEELDQATLEVLFAHTRQLRRGNLFIEDRKRESRPELVWVRNNRSRSRSLGLRG